MNPNWEFKFTKVSCVTLCTPETLQPKVDSFHCDKATKTCELDYSFVMNQMNTRKQVAQTAGFYNLGI